MELSTFRCAPVLCIGFNRPELLRELLRSLASAAPSRVFVALDGPRPDRPEDVVACAAARETMNNAIDWPCETKTLFRETNRGCRHAPPEAIDWFFGHVDAGIILEDDCHPTPDFLRYASELLVRYRDDDRVGAICGTNHYGFQTDRAASYHFSTHLDVWGWATWRRAWAAYDNDMTPYLPDLESILRRFSPNRRARAFLRNGVRAVQQGLPTWDYQCSLAFAARGFLCAAPRVRLVRNRGMEDKAATNTGGYSYDAHLAQNVGSLPFPLVHPAEVAPDLRAVALRERREHGLLPRALTLLGARCHCLGHCLTRLGSAVERVFPALFRL